MSLIDRAMSKQSAHGVAAPVEVAARVAKLPVAPAPINRPPRHRRMEIDTRRLKMRWYRDSKGARNTLARDFLDIKQPLLDHALGRGVPALPNGRRIMVTSALPREGKTYCAINLALSIASERGCGVVLVDADIARPSVLRELGIETNAVAGLTEWVDERDGDLSNLVLNTNIKRFRVLPAGRRHQRAPELLATDAMRQVLDRLTCLYPDEIIIFDSPPLMVSNDAPMLAALMGQVVVVVAAGQTERDVVTQALARLDTSHVAGVILNKVSSRSPNRHGAY